jgi:hypothetical protein
LLNYKVQGNAEFAGMLKRRGEFDDNPLIQELGSTFVSVDIKFGSRLGMVLGSALGTALEKRLRIELWSKLGLWLHTELGEKQGLMIGQRRIT